MISLKQVNVGSEASKYIEMATSDLAKKLAIGKENITLKDVTQKDWSNTSLGCPKKDMLYAQVIVPGYVIVLDVSGIPYVYHAGSNRVVSCQGN